MTSTAKLAVVASFTSAPAALCGLGSFATSPVAFQLPLGALARAHRRHCRNTPPPKCVLGGEIATVHCRPGMALAFPSVFRYIRLAELRGACWISIPGALSISKGAVPGLAHGLGHTAPTYAVGSRDRYPTAIAAPRLPIFPLVASCSSPSRPFARGLWRGGARRAPRPPPLTPRISRPKGLTSSCACAPGPSRPIFRLRANPRPCLSLHNSRAPGLKR